MARGQGQSQLNMLAFIDLEERVPQDHPLRRIKMFADAALAELSPIFDAMYAADGATLDSAGALAQGESVDRALFGAQ